MWWLILLSLLATANTVTQARITMITFDTPGNYQLTPQDYQYSPQIIVEMWGAGGGGCSGDCGIGGGSGAYIKATINTNLETFNLTVGLGGKGGDGAQTECYSTGCAYPWLLNSKNYSGYNGTDTKIISLNNNLVAGGGLKGNTTVHNCYSSETYTYYPCYNNGGRYNIGKINGNTNITSNGNSGTLGYNKSGGLGCIQITNYCDNTYVIGAGNGGNSPYGNSGGVGSNTTHCPSISRQQTNCMPSTNVNYWISSSINGSLGSGGGGTYESGYICATACQYIQNYCFYKVFQQAGYGGNGTINIYYQVDPSTTATQTVSHSTTPSVTSTGYNTMFMFNSHTVTPTSTMSFSNTTSPTITPTSTTSFSNTASSDISIRDSVMFKFIIAIIAIILIVIISISWLIYIKETYKK